MEEKVRSKISRVSNLKRDGDNRAGERTFEWWGPSPEEARKRMVNKSKALKDKRASLREAVQKYIRDGITIGIGGFVNTRVPVAIVHEIIRKGAKDLSLCFQSSSICAELLAGAMLLDRESVV